MPNILLTIGMVALVLAVVYSVLKSIADSVWDRIEDDVAKQEGYDKIKK